MAASGRVGSTVGARKKMLGEPVAFRLVVFSSSSVPNPIGVTRGSSNALIYTEMY